jgi:hypothetical protein
MEASDQLHAPHRFTQLEIVLRTHLIRALADARAGLNAMKETNLGAVRKRTPAIQPVARRYTDYPESISINITHFILITLFVAATTFLFLRRP